MAGGRGAHVQSEFNLVRLPPIELDDAIGRKTAAFCDVTIAERGDEEGVRKAGAELTERALVAVVVVIVTEENGINGGQGFEGDSRGVRSTGTGPNEWARALAEDGVDQ